MANSFEEFDKYLHKIRVDNDPSGAQFIGYSRNNAALSSDPVWLIKRIFTSGNFVSIDYASVGGYQGTYTGVWDSRASYFTAAPFNNGRAILANGANEQILFGNVAPLKFTHTTPFSISIWFKTFASGTICLIGKQGAANALGYRIELVGGNLRFHLSGGAAGNRIDIRAPTSTYNNGQWYHVVCTYAGDQNANKCKMIVNGAALAFTVSANTLISTIDTTIAFQVCGRNGNTETFNGFLDESSVWSIDLSLANAQEIYNSGDPNNLSQLSFYTSANLEHWCRLGDNTTVPTFPDLSANMNNGTSANMTSANIVSETP